MPRSQFDATGGSVGRRGRYGGDRGVSPGGWRGWRASEKVECRTANEAAAGAAGVGARAGGGWCGALTRNQPSAAAVQGAMGMGKQASKQTRADTETHTHTHDRQRLRFPCRSSQGGCEVAK